MKFYVMKSTMGEIIGCELTKREAREEAENAGWQRHEYDIETIEADVNSETVRRLLGNLGGYAK